MQNLPIDPLIAWFQAHKRSLPWRNAPSPYEVWISEVMLQQTQVSVVVPYYERWMRCFPSIADLAAADLDQVIKLWEGLGYYSRARHLHQAAKYLMEHHGGQLPNQREQLEKVVGLGPYTIGAILSFAFHQKSAAVDGNVIRVLSRYTALEEVVCLSQTQKKIKAYAEAILPDHEPWVVAEALIELGATVCGREPKCYLCPLSPSCEGLKKGIADQLPNKKKKQETTYLHRYVAVVVAEGSLLLQRGAQGEVMADLYEFPYFSSEEERSYFLAHYGIDSTPDHHLSETAQTFTRFRVKLYPAVWKALCRIEVPDYHWIALSEVKNLPFSAGHRRILREYENFAH